MSIVVTSRVQRTASGRGGARGWMAYVMGYDAGRSAAYRSDLGDPPTTVAAIESLIHPTKRTTEAVSVVHSFSASELDSSNPDDVQAAVDLTYEMLRRASPTEPVVVVAHTDSKGGFLHVHGLVINHNLETGKANSNALMHWQIRAVNDELMEEVGLEVVQRRELAHDRSHALARHRGEPVPTEDQAAALDINELDTKTWRAWMATRLDELVWDDRVIDIDTLTDVAAEIGISIRQQTATKRSGGLPTLTYALVDDACDVRRDGRRRLAGSQSKIGDAYTYQGLTETLAMATEEKEKERTIHEQSSHEAQAAAAAEQQAIDDALGSLHVATVRAEPAHTPSQSNPEPSPALTQLRQITTVLGDLVPAVNQMSTNQESLSQRLTTLEERVNLRLSSPPPNDDSENSSSESGNGTTLLTLVDQSQEQAEILSRQMATLIVEIRNQSSATKSALRALEKHHQVTLPNGTQMSSADFGDMKNGRAVVAETQKLISSSDELIAAVKAAGTPTIAVDTRQLAQQAARDLDKRLSHAVEQSVSDTEKRLEKASADTVAKIDTAASKAATTVAKRLAQASQHLDQINNATDRTEKRVKNISVWMPWSNLGRILVALIPPVLAVLVLSGVAHTVVVDVLGLPILSVWLWSQMVAASTWWATLLWATAGLGSVVGLGWALFSLGQWLHDHYQGWS